MLNLSKQRKEDGDTYQTVFAENGVDLQGEYQALAAAILNDKFNMDNVLAAHARTHQQAKAASQAADNVDPVDFDVMAEEAEEPAFPSVYAAFDAICVKVRALFPSTLDGTQAADLMARIIAAIDVGTDYDAAFITKPVCLRDNIIILLRTRMKHFPRPKRSLNLTQALRNAIGAKPANTDALRTSQRYLHDLIVPVISYTILANDYTLPVLNHLYKAAVEFKTAMANKMVTRSYMITPTDARYLLEPVMVSPPATTKMDKTARESIAAYWSLTRQFLAPSAGHVAACDMYEMSYNDPFNNPDITAIRLATSAHVEAVAFIKQLANLSFVPTAKNAIPIPRETLLNITLEELLDPRAVIMFRLSEWIAESVWNTELEDKINTLPYYDSFIQAHDAQSEAHAHAVNLCNSTEINLSEWMNQLPGGQHGEVFNRLVANAPDRSRHMLQSSQDRIEMVKHAWVVPALGGIRWIPVDENIHPDSPISDAVIQQVRSHHISREPVAQVFPLDSNYFEQVYGKLPLHMAWLHSELKTYTRNARALPNAAALAVALIDDMRLYMSDMEDQWILGLLPKPARNITDFTGLFTQLYGQIAAKSHLQTCACLDVMLRAASCPIGTVVTEAVLGRAWSVVRQIKTFPIYKGAAPDVAFHAPGTRFVIEYSLVDLMVHTPPLQTSLNILASVFSILVQHDVKIFYDQRPRMSLLMSCMDAILLAATVPAVAACIPLFPLAAIAYANIANAYAQELPTRPITTGEQIFNAMARVAYAYAQNTTAHMDCVPYALSVSDVTESPVWDARQLMVRVLGCDAMQTMYRLSSSSNTANPTLSMASAVNQLMADKHILLSLEVITGATDGVVHTLLRALHSVCLYVAPIIIDDLEKATLVYLYRLWTFGREALSISEWLNTAKQGNQPMYGLDWKSFQPAPMMKVFVDILSQYVLMQWMYTDLALDQVKAIAVQYQDPDATGMARLAPEMGILAQYANTIYAGRTSPPRPVEKVIPAEEQFLIDAGSERPLRTNLVINALNNPDFIPVISLSLTYGELSNSASRASVTLRVAGLIYQTNNPRAT